MNINPGMTRMALLFTIMAVAQAQQPPVSVSAPGLTAEAPGEQRSSPPPEAYQACTGKSPGSRAELVSPRGDTVAGVCEDDGHGKIVLRPDRPDNGTAGGHHRPPPEAYQVCVGKTAGSRAQFTNPRGDTVSGTCQSEGQILVLRPDRPPHGGGEAAPGR